jgi:hypothetical protein
LSFFLSFSLSHSPWFFFEAKSFSSIQVSASRMCKNRSGIRCDKKRSAPLAPRKLEPAARRERDLPSKPQDPETSPGHPVP